MEEIIYISINNWFSERDYPEIEPIETWLSYSEEDDWDNVFRYLDDKKFVEENKICVAFTIIDMSFDYGITAPKSWVDKNIPEIYNYPKFLMKPDENGEIRGRYSTKFLNYDEENIGKIKFFDFDKDIGDYVEQKGE